MLALYTCVRPNSNKLIQITSAGCVDCEANNSNLRKRQICDQSLITLHQDLAVISLIRLHKIDVGQGLDGLGGGLDGVEVANLGLSVLAFEGLLRRLAGPDFLLVLVVGLAPGDDLVSALGWKGVGSGDVNLLLDDTAVNLSRKHFK